MDNLGSDHSSKVAAALKAAGDPMRLDILKIMRRDSFGVLELCQIFDVQQPSMSHHLKVMVKAGLLGSRREGNSIFYRRVQNAQIDEQRWLNQIYAIADAGGAEPPVLARVEHIQAERKQKSQQFFQQNVDSFREQQDLIASHGDYGDAVQDLMRFGNELTWLEVGAGAGDLVAEVHQKFKQVCALDISQELLKQAEKRINSGQVDFFLGDTSEALANNVRADCITCNMVLHHVPSPAAVILDAAQMLNPDGQLLVCDLDEHDQEWARTSCGDLWLGFSADEISQWALDASLKEGRSQFLALRNGFRVQIREFIKG